MEANLTVSAPELKDNASIDRLKETVRGGIETAKAKVVEGYEKASEKVHHALDKAADTSIHDVQDSVVTYVRRNPTKSLLIAAGTGLLIGFLLRSRRD